MDLQKEKYVIVEIIPTHSRQGKGFIAQISALKLKGIQLEDRFDYRVEDQFIESEDIKNMISYEKEMFTYTANIYSILEKFQEWIGDYPLILLDDTYTLDYLKEIPNAKELVYPYLELDYTNDVFEKLMKKYHLQPTNHLVDLIYEAIIYEGNNKKS